MINDDIINLDGSTETPQTIKSTKGLFADKQNRTPSRAQVQNMQSKLNQWRLSNLQLDQAFEVQKETAQTDIKDRFLQVYDLSKQNYELEKVLQNLGKLEVIEQMVNILTERGLQMA